MELDFKGNQMETNKISPLGTCWSCGDNQGPWSLEQHPKLELKIWLCPKCDKELQKWRKEHESNNGINI